MNIVLDTDVIVAAMRSLAGASAELLRRARQEQITLAASVSLFMEYEAVCTRPEHLEASGLIARQLDFFLDGLASIVQPVEVHFLWRPQLRDPAGELVLEAAVNTSARALLTFNQKHFVGVAKRFQFEVITPGEFLWSLP